MTYTPLRAEYRGYQLTLVEGDLTGGEGIWSASGTSAPIPMGTIHQVKSTIDRYEADKQAKGGIEVWDISHDSPKYWYKREAVFRTVKAPYEKGTTTVLTAASQHNPDRLAAMKLENGAPDTDEANQAIEHAKEVYAELVEVSKRWRAAKFAIPGLKPSDVQDLPEREYR